MVVGFAREEWELIGFQQSKNKSKKYTAIIMNKENGKIKYIGFGSRKPLMEHYEDKTGLNLYEDLNHYDEERRKRFQQRFRSKFNPDYYSPTYMSYIYLW